MNVQIWKLLAATALAMALIGCDSAPPAPSGSSNANSGPATATPTPAASPAASPVTSPTPNSAAGPAMDPQKSPSHTGDDLNRINQLRTLKHVPIKVAGQKVEAWVMDNESKREEGMMFLTDSEVKENQGMIFVFPDVQAASNSFWMHNCPMGLDIVYIDSNRRVINVGDGKPESDDQVTANSDYRWVLELKRGWAKRHGLKAKDLVGIPALTTSE